MLDYALITCQQTTWEGESPAESAVRRIRPPAEARLKSDIVKLGLRVRDDVDTRWLHPIGDGL